jgi:hypothetical protein
MLLVYFILVSALLPINCVDSMLRLRAPVATRTCLTSWAKLHLRKKIWSPLNLPQRYVGLTLYSSSIGISEDSIGKKTVDILSASLDVKVKPSKIVKRAVKQKLPKILEIKEDAAR